LALWIFVFAFMIIKMLHMFAFLGSSWPVVYVTKTPEGK